MCRRIFWATARSQNDWLTCVRCSLAAHLRLRLSLIVFALPMFGAAIEKGGSADERVQVNSSRLVVVSNATFIQDKALTQDQQSLDFISGSVNWLLSREQLIGIAPKIPRPLTFTLDENGLRSLRWMILVLMPLIPAVIGSVVWWQRRV